MSDDRSGGTATTVLGGGCFWCVEAVFKELQGVLSVQSGYAGGHTERPRYKEVCSGNTGHAEVVRVEYDPAAVSFDDLLRVFFTIHDPTQLNRQGNDVGTQYRSVIYVHDDAERARAEAIVAEVAAEGVWDGRIVTEIAPMPVFWPAEQEHEDYFALNPNSGYCQVVVAPKVAKFRKRFADRLQKRPA